MEAATINIQVNFQQLKAAVMQLSPAEKLEISDLLWEVDIEIVDNIEIPIETQNLVLARMKYAEENPEVMLDWDKVKDSLIP